MNPEAPPTVFYERTNGLDLHRLAGEWGKFLDEQETERFRGLRLERDRRDYLAAHVLLRLALRDHWGRDPARPLPTDRAGWSLTHCDGLAACALTVVPGGGGSGLGVDAEPLDASERLATMPETFLAAGDAGWLDSDQALRPRRLVELWTVKDRCSRRAAKASRDPQEPLHFERWNALRRGLLTSGRLLRSATSTQTIAFSLGCVARESTCLRS